MFDYFKKDLEQVLSSTKDIWSNKTNKTIFLTGGTGFFGVWFQMSFLFINRKLNLNSRLIVLTRNEKKFLKKHPWLAEYNEISFKEGDIVNFDFFDEKVDYIIHAATEASVDLNINHPLTMFNTVVNGTNRILEFARLNKVDGFLLTSSGAVYGVQPVSCVNISEDYIGAPLTTRTDSMYGEGKRMAEVLCSVYHNHFSLPIKIARCYAFMGPFLPLDSHFAAGNFIRNILGKEDIIISGDGSPIRSYMYPTDLMIWLWTILFKGDVNQPYNVGSDKSISILELACLIAKLRGSKKTNIIVKEQPKNIPSNIYVPNVTKAKTELKLEELVSLRESITKTYDFYLAQTLRK